MLKCIFRQCYNCKTNEKITILLYLTKAFFNMSSWLFAGQPYLKTNTTDLKSSLPHSTGVLYQFKTGIINVKNKYVIYRLGRSGLKKKLSRSH